MEKTKLDNIMYTFAGACLIGNNKYNDVSENYEVTKRKTKDLMHEAFDKALKAGSVEKMVEAFAKEVEAL